VSRLRSIVERSYEAFNARDFDAYRELLDENVEFVAAGITLRGRAAVTDFMAVNARARPGLRIELQRVFAETDDRLVAESRRIDTAPAASAEGAGVVESAASALYRVADGRIVEMHVYVDQAAEDPPAVRMAVAAEQAALLRVAELVARQAPSEEVFALVTEELSHVLDVNVFGTVRFEPDGSMTLLAGSGEYALSPGTNLPLPSGTVVEQVFRTGRPVRLEGYSEVAGPIGDALHQEGARSGAGGPIVVDGALWGAMAVGSTARTLPPGTEDRVAQFAELVSTAISNLESRAKV
jgi:ketosteroid isomerase-like protein